MPTLRCAWSTARHPVATTAMVSPRWRRTAPWWPTGPIFGSVADRHAAGAAAGLAGLVTEGGAGCLGTCAGSGCGRVFIDNGPVHGKRYCSEVCASGANVHAFRASGRRGGGQRPASTAAG